MCLFTTSEPDPPQAMMQLHKKIAETNQGWGGEGEKQDLLLIKIVCLFTTVSKNLHRQ